MSSLSPNPPAAEACEPYLTEVTLTLCSLCLDGRGGECHTPGCALWMNRAPDIPLWHEVNPVILDLKET
jgi:hypothetical protein